MVSSTVALLIEEVCNVSAAELCGILEELTELVSDDLEVISLACTSECVLELIVAPAES